MSALTLNQQLLKRAARELTSAAGGGEGAATACRLGKSQLLGAGSVNEPDRYLPADVIGDLEDVTRGAAGWPHVTRVLAARQGFELVKLPEAGRGTDWLKLIGQLSKEGGDVVSRIAERAAGGLTAAEVREADLVREFDELIRVAVEGRAAALAVLGGE